MRHTPHEEDVETCSPPISRSRHLDCTIVGKRATWRKLPRPLYLVPTTNLRATKAGRLLTLRDKVGEVITVYWGLIMLSLIPCE